MPIKPSLSAIRPHEPKILEAADPTTPVPQLTFTDRMTIHLGGKSIELIYTGRNHSDNSLVVLLPQNKLLFAVDFIPVESVAYRALPDGYPDEWVESLKQVERLDFDTLVPGHGKVGKKEHVRLFREYLEALRAAVSEQIQSRREPGGSQEKRPASHIRTVVWLCRLVHRECRRHVPVSLAAVETIAASFPPLGLHHTHFSGRS